MFLNWYEARRSEQIRNDPGGDAHRATQIDGKLGKRMGAKKHEAMLHQLEQHVTRFGAEHKLNAYKKAQLGNRSSGPCVDKGYDAEYVDQLTHSADAQARHRRQEVLSRRRCSSGSGAVAPSARWHGGQRLPPAAPAAPCRASRALS